MTPERPEPEQSPPNGPRRRRITRALVIGAPALVIAGAVLTAVLLMQSRPTARQARPSAAPKARLVTVAPARAAPASLRLEANGTVEAAQSTRLRARVSGQITALYDNLAPGTRFAKGTALARVDDADYQLALEKARTQLANAQASLDMENGQQAVARRELALIGQDVSARERKLALRGPQLSQAKANLGSAQSAVDQARLDLDRTRVHAPFAGIVIERSASVGDVITPTDTLATIAATNAYWVNVSLPVDQLRWLHAPGRGRPGSSARIYYPDAWGVGPFMDARVLRIQAALETSGRMARVLLRVPHPLGANAPGGHRLLIGAYVQARIKARIPADSVVVDSSYLHENNHIWVMTKQDELAIREVDVIYRDKARAVIAAGLKPGERVITSALDAAIPGMPVRAEGSQNNTAGSSAA